MLVLDATTATEDTTFWSNPGVDLGATLNAFVTEAGGGGDRGGGSTITQQLVRARLLPPDVIANDDTTEGLYNRKAKEILQAYVIANLEAAGATMVDPTDLAVDPIYETEYPAMLCEFKVEIAAYLETLPAEYPKTPQDLIDFNLENADLEMGVFKQETFDEAQAAAAIDDPSCVEARATATSTAQTAIDDLMAEHELDAILAPTGEPAWLTDPVAGDVYVGPYSAPPAAVAGYPSITFPVGYISGLPVGASLFGGKWSEPTLTRSHMPTSRPTRCAWRRRCRPRSSSKA